MPANFKVYISSTYEDLKEQRQEVARAVRALNLHTFAMQEDSTSTSKNQWTNVVAM